MGYISDVAAVFYAKKEALPLLKLFFKENFPYDDFEQCIEEFDNGAYAGFKFLNEDVKWYESFNDVKKFNEFVERFNALITDQGQPWYYEFCRVGEEYNDIEFDRGDRSECLLDVHRVIHFDV